MPAMTYSLRSLRRGMTGLLGLLVVSHVTGQPVGEVGIATAHPLATKAGEEILAAGGNAFDAAVAISAALAVVEPYASGLGGGGFWLLHEATSGRQTFVDAREVAPLAATPRLFLDEAGEPRPELTQTGPSPRAFQVSPPDWCIWLPVTGFSPCPSPWPPPFATPRKG